MNVIELAHALGEGIKNDPILLAYDAAKAAFEADAALSAQITEYNTHRACLGEEFNRAPEEQDKDVIESLKAKMDALAGDIHANAHYAAFAEAQQAVNDLMKRVNAEISYAAFGVRPEGCTHDCSTCGGCH